MNANDRLDAAIEKALGPGEEVRAPAGFVSRVEARVFYTALIARRRRMMRAAGWLGAGAAALSLLVAGLFIEAVDVPGLVVENVPGVLGRMDALRVGLARDPELALAAAGAVLLAVAGVVSAALRPRRA